MKKLKYFITMFVLKLRIIFVMEIVMKMLMKIVMKMLMKFFMNLLVFLMQFLKILGGNSNGISKKDFLGNF